MPLLTGWTLVLGGCANPNPAADRAIALRTARLQDTVDIAKKEETRREPQMAYTLNLAREDIERDRDADLPSNVKLLSDRLDDDIERFEERQPRYRKDTLDVLRGKPETIEETAIKLFL